jgi:hypothetical protein
MSKVQAKAASKPDHDAILAPNEVKEWLDIFNRKKD